MLTMNIEKFNPARLKLAREEAGLSASSVVDKLKGLGITITDATLHNWERGVGAPYPDALSALANIYGRALVDFYYTPPNGETNNPN